MVTVVAAWIEKEGKVLLARRATGDEKIIGKWEFPGGKVEPHEEEKQAIEREIKEELELDIKAGEFLTNHVSHYSNRTIDLRLYRCQYKKGECKLHDHFEYRWIKKEEILNYDLVFADIPLAMYVLKKGEKNE